MYGPYVPILPSMFITLAMIVLKTVFLIPYLALTLGERRRDVVITGTTVGLRRGNEIKDHVRIAKLGKKFCSK